MHLAKYISFEIKTRILLFLKKFEKLNYFSYLKNSTNKKAYVFLAADYGNLGDIAITYSQTQFLKKSLKDYEIIDVPISRTLEGIFMIKKTIRKDDIVTIVGGGNFGDLYNQIEFYRKLVVESFSNNKIISFPQTMDFSNSKKGEKALLLAKKSYSRHKNLTFVAREKVSFNMMKDTFLSNNVILSPDIVMSLNKIEPTFKRNGVVLCLREDNEKLLKPEEQTKLMELVNKNFKTKSNYDTHINKDNLTVEKRIFELEKIWDVFKNAEFVITDRLHGMIFCYITNTPCLVFQNNNHKIKSSYEWIKNKSNIKLMDEFSEIEIAHFIINKDFSQLKYESLNESFEILLSEVIN